MYNDKWGKYDFCRTCSFILDLWPTCLVKSRFLLDTSRLKIQPSLVKLSFYQSGRKSVRDRAKSFAYKKEPWNCEL